MNSPAPALASATTPRPRNAYIDTLRGLAIFGVACIHFGGSFVTSANAWTPSFYLGLIFGQIFNFAVPLFIFLSGVLAGFGSARPSGSLWQYYRSRLLRIGGPYLAASAASFFLLNHYPEWQALPDLGARLVWLAQRIFYFGVEPTLYFIPLIIQLYLLQPVLKALPGWIRRLTGDRVSLEYIVLGLTLLLLVLHVLLGVLCYRNVLSYYVWCRPSALFWMVYFFGGLHFKALTSFLSRRLLIFLAGLGLVLAIGALVSDFSYLTDRTAVGANFEFNNMDYAYSRPQLLIYDLAIVGVMSVGIALGWTWRASLVSFLGQYTLDIYLWHILLLYEGAWRYTEVLESCRQMPEVILIISAFACLVIAGARHNYSVFVSFIRQYRLVLVRQSW